MNYKFNLIASPPYYSNQVGGTVSQGDFDAEPDQLADILPDMLSDFLLDVSDADLGVQSITLELFPQTES